MRSAAIGPLRSVLVRGGGMAVLAHGEHGRDTACAARTPASPQEQRSLYHDPVDAPEPASVPIALCHAMGGRAPAIGKDATAGTGHSVLASRSVPD